MLTRNLLDEIMPGPPSENPEDRTAITRLAVVVSRLCGQPVHVWDEPVMLEFCLRWMAEFTEADRFYGFGDRKPAWRTPDNPNYQYCYDISMRGLEYKDSSYYLTSEGWPTGTKCWYVCVVNGQREYVAGETPLLAALRAVIVMCLFARIREIDPKVRPSIEDALRDEMMEEATAEKDKWCITHRRASHRCLGQGGTEGGIAIPCEVVEDEEMANAIIEARKPEPDPFVQSGRLWIPRAL